MDDSPNQEPPVQIKQEPLGGDQQQQQSEQAADKQPHHVESSLLANQQQQQKEEDVFIQQQQHQPEQQQQQPEPQQQQPEPQQQQPDPQPQPTSTSFTPPVGNSNPLSNNNFGNNNNDNANEQSGPQQGTNNEHLFSTKRWGNILEAIKDFESSIPDPVVHHFLNVAGMQTNDQRIIRLIAIAAQKFIHDIVSDSLQHCKLRGAQGKKTKDKRYALVIKDLASALAEYGIEVRRQQYFN